MNLLIYSTSNQVGKLLLNSNFSSAVSTASGLGYPNYLISKNEKTVVINNPSGLAYQAFLTGTTNQQINLMIFDTDETAALSYISTNYPDETIVTFGKTNVTVQ